MDPEHPNTQHAQAVLETKETKDPNSPVNHSYETETQAYGATLLQPERDVLSVTEYRLYKRRWIGLGTLPNTTQHVSFDLTGSASRDDFVEHGHSCQLDLVLSYSECRSVHIPCLLCLHFSPLRPASTEFGISLTQVNWLANSVNLIYLPSSIAVPLVAQRWGIRSVVSRFPIFPTILLTLWNSA